MSYAPVDTYFWGHPKVLALGKDIDALALWILALSWSTGLLTDGYLPSDMVGRLAQDTHHHTRKRWARALVRVGLWEEVVGKGYRFHDYLEWQRPSNEIKEKQRVKQRAGHLGGAAKAKAEKLARATAAAMAEKKVAIPTLAVAVAAVKGESQNPVVGDESPQGDETGRIPRQIVLTNPEEVAHATGSDSDPARNGPSPDKAEELARYRAYLITAGIEPPEVTRP